MTFQANHTTTPTPDMNQKLAEARGKGLSELKKIEKELKKVRGLGEDLYPR